MSRLLLCSMTVPWPSRPTQGLYHVDQAIALTRAGLDTTILSPAPMVPPGLARVSKWAKRHVERPDAYEIRGVDLLSPRVPFAYPNAVREKMSPVLPGLIGAYCSASLTGMLKRSIRQTNSDALLAHGMLPWGAAAVAAGRFMGVPVGVIEHSAGDVMRLRRGSALARYYTHHAKQVGSIFVVNRRMKRHLEQELGLRNVVLALNGVELEGVQANREPRPDRFAGKKLILSAAHYYRRKGFEELLIASAPLLRQRSDLALVVITDAPPNLKRLANDLGVADRVEFLPKCDRQTLMRWMGWADLFAMPSWSESFGLVYAEAMAAGTPVLMTTDAGISDELPVGSGLIRGPAWVVPPRSTQTLTMALSDAASDLERLKWFGKQSARLIDGKFSWSRNAQVIATQLLDRQGD